MPPTPQVAIRLALDVIARLDAYAADNSPPGVPLSRSDTIRVLLELALAAEGYGANQASKPAKAAKRKAAPKGSRRGRKAAALPKRATAPTPERKPQASASGAHKPADGPDAITVAIERAERAEREAMRGKG